MCEHKECAAGWITENVKYVTEKRARDGSTVQIENWYDIARPCPTCDPERAHIFATSKNADELQERLKARSTTTRIKIQEDYEASRTKTL